MNAVRTLLAAYPRLARVNPEPTVRRWLSEGADLDLDILPVVKHWIAKKDDIYSLGFFTPYVHASRDARIARQFLTPKQRAERIALLVRKLGYRYPTDERWLASYEAVHGTVVV